MKRKLLIVFTMVCLVGMAANSALLMAEHESRSGKQRAVIIGGSTAAGAVIGGVMGGKKGALAGAIAGGAGSAIYDGATKNRGHRDERSTKDKVVLIGGSSAAGATVGGIAGGKKGAVIGAAVGAAGGYILHKKTDRNRGF